MIRLMTAMIPCQRPYQKPAGLSWVNCASPAAQETNNITGGIKIIGLSNRKLKEFIAVSLMFQALFIICMRFGINSMARKADTVRLTISTPPLG
jgi:hypothetical protein